MVLKKLLHILCPLNNIFLVRNKQLFKTIHDIVKQVSKKAAYPVTKLLKKTLLLVRLVFDFITYTIYKTVCNRLFHDSKSR